MKATVARSAIIGVLLSSCAAQLHYDKVGGGGTNEEFQRTFAKCKVQAAMVPDNAGNFTPLIMSSVRDNCMRAEGWVRNPSCDPNWQIC